MHNEDLDKGLGVASPLLYDVQTNVYYAADNTMITDDAITIDILADADDVTVGVDAVHVYIYIHGPDPKGRGKPSSTREPDGIG